MNELEFLAILTRYIEEYKEGHYIGAEYGQEGSEILSFLAWITQQLNEKKQEMKECPYCGDTECYCPHIEKKEKMR